MPRSCSDLITNGFAGLPHSGHISAHFQKLSQVQVNIHEKTEAFLGHLWCSNATIFKQPKGVLVKRHYI
jgi:hypothetical protein